MLTAGLAGALPGTSPPGSRPSAAAGARSARSGRPDPTPLRTAAPLAVGLLITALCAGAAGTHTVAPQAMVVDVRLAVEVPLVGLFFAVGAYLLGLLGQAQGRTPLVRLRAWLDGTSVGVCTFYTIWLLVFSRDGGLHGASMTASLLGSIALGAAVASALYATAHRRRMLWSWAPLSTPADRADHDWTTAAHRW